uniref:Ig-like domain-containing protein n=1 Tax=Paramormyrops kingsleyae TaxID=1676925 RepID=A0A3B3Q7P0_9TELE
MFIKLPGGIQLERDESRRVTVFYSYEPVYAHAGEDVTLSCSVDTHVNVTERADSDTIVHLFEGGQSRPESQGDTYRGRARFFSQEIPKGNFSLLLEGVRTADAGVYKCVVYTEQEQRETRGGAIRNFGWAALHTMDYITVQ